MTFDQWWKHIFGDKKIPDWIHETVVRNAYEAAVLAEREACAKVCEDLIGTRAMARHCADAIRARGSEK
jgi:hypothetical protein